MPLGEFSIFCFEFLSDFWRKSQNERGKKLGKNRAFAAEKAASRDEGCLAAAKATSQRSGFVAA